MTHVAGNFIAMLHLKKAKWVFAPLLVFLFGASFLLSTYKRDIKNSIYFEQDAAVVIPAGIQIFLYGGERFLAANIEAARAAMSGGNNQEKEAQFRLKAHLEVSKLNPCHEDNYWIGNGELTWGGSHRMGFHLLRTTIDCRDWDEWPAFFYAFNQAFFEQNIQEARHALEIAVERTKDEKNKAFFRTLSIMIGAAQFSDARMALRLVEKERDKATEPRLRERLDMRVRRLHGLVSLRDAQAAFEMDNGRPLADPQELVNRGYILTAPEDPLGIGYVFENGKFQLHSRKNDSLEQLRTQK